MSITNQEEFAARLARVREGAPNTKGTIFVGQDERHHLGKKEVVKPKKGREIAGNTLYPLSLIGAFCLGLVAVAVGYYARFQLTQGQSQLEDADLEMALSGAIGLMLSFVLAQLFRITSKTHKAMQSAGVFVMVCSFHNFAFWAPGLSATLLSPEWVVQVQNEAPPNSAKFRGVFFPLFDDGSVSTIALAGATEPTEAGAAADCEAAAPASTVTMLQTDNAKKPVKTGHKRVAVSEAGCAAP